MLGADHDERIRPLGLECNAHAIEVRVELITQRGTGALRAAGDAGRVAQDAGKYETHDVCPARL